MEVQLRVISDVHLDHFNNKIKKLWKYLCQTIPEVGQRKVIPIPEDDSPPTLEEIEEEVKDLEQTAPDEILILAGDLGQPVNLKGTVNQSYHQLLVLFRQRWDRIILIAGNHEYFRHGNKVNSILTQLCEELGIHFLNENTITLSGLKFVGCTLWSDITRAHYRQMNNPGEYPVNHAHYLALHKSHLNFIEEELELSVKAQTPTVVLTHHVPSPKLIHPRFPSHTGYCTDLDAMIAHYSPVVKMWICGHSHETVITSIDSCLLVLNPLGTPNESRQRRSPPLGCTFPVTL